jgi:ABC-type dipeptide/oligopeptide/nickel transport system ATPase component
MIRPSPPALPHASGAQTATGNVLEIRDLTIETDVARGPASLVSGVNLQVASGEVLGLVGESGSGKSMTALAVMGLLPNGVSRTTGEIRIDGTDVAAMPDKDRARYRGRTASMIFQEPMTSLNPVYRVGRQITEVLREHLPIGRAQARDRAVALLEEVGIPDPLARARAYPHELSGGMRQRVMIAIALACDPHLLIADEPTTALDVTVQAQVLRLLRDLGRRHGTAIVMVSHDMGVIAEMADHIAVMRRGRIVETGAADDVLERPKDTYTRLLLAAIPRVDRPRPEGGRIPIGEEDV